MELSGARVLVVGASGVLGEGIAARLRDAGARLALTSRTTGRLDDLAGRLRPEHTAVLDLVDVEACRRVVDQTAEALGGLDAVVVASGSAAFGAAEEEDDAVVEELFAVNTLGPMAVVRAALRHLGSGGAVAAITAILADHPTAGMAAYSASKSATSAYLSALRREVRRRRITVLDARPPHMETGLAERALAGDPPRMPAGHDIDDVLDTIVRGITEGAAELVADPTSGRLELR